MTAVGLLLMVVGLLVGVTFGTPSPRTYNLADRIGVLLFWTGFAAWTAGVVRWLWSVMP